jgi:hypothetical protein
MKFRMTKNLPFWVDVEHERAKINVQAARADRPNPTEISRRRARPCGTSPKGVKSPGKRCLGCWRGWLTLSRRPGMT